MASLTGTLLANLLTKLSGNVNAALGPNGELITAPLHSQWYHQAVNKQLFMGATAIAGTIIPVNAATLNSTFTLANPAGSGVNLELANYRLAVDGTTTAVIGSLDLVFQASYTAFTSTTLGGITSCLIGSGAVGKAILYSAATFTGTPSLFSNLGLSFGTTGDSPGPISAIADLTGLVVAPGTAIAVAGNAAQTQAMAQAIMWAEVPT